MKKKKYLFYYEEAVNAWIPCPDEIESIVSIDEFEHEEDDKEVIFKVFWMTKEEFNNLPVE